MEVSVLNGETDSAQGGQDNGALRRSLLRCTNAHLGLMPAGTITCNETSFSQLLGEGCESVSFFLVAMRSEDIMILANHDVPNGACRPNAGASSTLSHN
jgi:hypothetical protein